MKFGEEGVVALYQDPGRKGFGGKTDAERGSRPTLGPTKGKSLDTDRLHAVLALGHRKLGAICV